MIPDPRPCPHSCGCAPTPEAAAREAVWGYLRDYPDCSITWTESAYIAQLAVEAWKKASGHA